VKIYVVVYKKNLTGAGFYTREEAEDFVSDLKEKYIGNYPIYEITLGFKMPETEVIR